VWLTPAGNLGTYPEGVFFQLPLLAEVVDDTLFYRLIAGELPTGVQLTDTGAIVGVPYVNVQGVPSLVSRDTVSKFAVRAYTKKTVGTVTVVNRLADRTFSMTVAGQDVPEFITPPGLIATYFDGSQVIDLQIEYTDTDPLDAVIVRLIAGTLPPGTTITTKGVISGFIAPETPSDAIAGFSRDGQGYDEYDFDFSTNSLNVNYEFILEVTDGKSSNIRTFNIQVYSRDSLTADTTDFTADNTFITADGSPVRPPLLLTPEGSIGTVRNDNFYAFKFDGIDLDGNTIVYDIIVGAGVGYDSDPYDTTGFDRGTYELPPGLTLDPNSGWLYGYIPNTGLTEQTYDFSVRVSQLDNPDVTSPYQSYSLTIIGQIGTEIIWTTPNTAVDRALNPSPLGTINTGAISTLYVSAYNVDGIGLEYRLKSGSDSRLPQGLELMSSGNIVGRVSFNTFALDGGTTTFDVVSSNRNVTSPTTFDMEFVFTVEAFNGGSNISVYKTFSIVVNREFNTPYENLYIQAMPPQNDRDLINDLLQNTIAIPVESLYRADDPNFGRATQVVYNHAYGLTAATYIDYVSSLYLNHYWKNLVLGEIATARALDPVTGEVLYEVVYSRVVDNLVNSSGQSVGKQVVIPYPIDPSTPAEIDVVYPNSLINMRDQVIDVVGQSSNLLPLWMLSKQTDGRVLGFTPAWVIAYVKPGQSGQVAYNIRTQFGTSLNLIDFQVDRYELDRALTHNWSPEYDQWVPQPPAETTFDLSPGPQTVFDGGSLRFITPVDIYLDSNTQDYDKYLVFPRRNIISPVTPIIPAEPVTWTNNSSATVEWVNDDTDAVEWINDPSQL
jgi:hypothetical protein